MAGIEIGEYAFIPDGNIILGTIDISEHAAGIYFVVVEGNNIHYAKKVLLQ